MGERISSPAHEASEAVLHACLPGLVEHFARQTGDVMLAEDLVQEAALVVLQRPKAFLQMSNPEGYCFQIVRNLYLEWLRKEGRRATYAAASPPDVLQAPDVAEEVAEQRQQRWLKGLVGRLPAWRDRALLERVLTYGQDKASICEALDLSSRHYDRVLHRATSRLRTQVLEQTMLA